MYSILDASCTCRGFQHFFREGPLKLPCL
ncbi:MAG: SWIM zinc finger family protein [Proteobacteria bacterium]|nr:SWIM zinc finger family protein [Pseudomonadota bacterium]